MKQSISHKEIIIQHKINILSDNFKINIQLGTKTENIKTLRPNPLLSYIKKNKMLFQTNRKIHNQK